MDKCPICLEIINKKDLIKTICNHNFHFLCYCINFIVYTDDKCPICRKIQKKIDISGKKNKKIRRILKRKILDSLKEPCIHNDDECSNTIALEDIIYIYYYLEENLHKNLYFLDEIINYICENDCLISDSYLYYKNNYFYIYDD